MNIKGKLIEKLDTQKITDSFKKREFVVEYAENPMYPEFVKFELIQDRCDLIEPFNLNDEIEIDFNLKGRKWTDKQNETKYFNSLQAWKIAPAQGMSTPSEAPPAEVQSQQQGTAAPSSEATAPSSEPEWIKNSDASSTMEDDDLPF